MLDSDRCPLYRRSQSLDWLTVGTQAAMPRTGPWWYNQAARALDCSTSAVHVPDAIASEVGNQVSVGVRNANDVMRVRGLLTLIEAE